MLNAYHPESWHELFSDLGGAIAALTGLLFVAMSLHVDKSREAPSLRPPLAYEHLRSRRRFHRVAARLNSIT
jgi:hypothetical protein